VCAFDSPQKLTQEHKYTVVQTHAQTLTNRMAAATACALTVNVGGVLYHTTQSTLFSRGGMLGAMFSPDGAFSFTKSSTSDSTPFIDRDGELFKYVLQYLRDGHISVPDGFRSDERKALRCEALYYGLDGLLDALDPADGLVPALHEGSPMLRCTRVVYGIDATKAEYSQSWSRQMCKHDASGFGHQRGTLLSGVVVVPSTSKGKLCYAITQEPNGKSLSGHEFDWGDDTDDILSILHADVNYNTRYRIEKKIARITPSVVQQFDWRP
jgi:BTB/POZ domain